MNQRHAMTRRAVVFSLLAIGLLMLLAGYGMWLYVRVWVPYRLQAAAADEKARVGGKYDTLLRRIKVAQDRQGYGDFTDYGYWEGNAYAGYNNLPRGYWVYAYPHWYIWANATPRAEPEEGAGAGRD